MWYGFCDRLVNLRGVRIDTSPDACFHCRPLGPRIIRSSPTTQSHPEMAADGDAHSLDR
jgi:hypothetical protein